MDFISNKESQIEQMLQVIGVNSIEELFSDIPKELMIKAINEDDGLSEFEGLKLMEKLSLKNTFPKFDNYLGAGSYEHHVPAIVSAICSKSEFLTAYTPYQPEISQGMLQAIFEYQSAICALTGLDVSNASLYDGASAAAESLLMSIRLNPEKNQVMVAESLHPHYKDVIKQYLSSHKIEIDFIPFNRDGSIDLKYIAEKLNHNTAAVLVGYPNFFGLVEDVKKVKELTQKCQSLLIVSANPLVYGLYESANELGADIAVGDTQVFGLSMQFGGPYVGYIACKESLVRQLPGRIVGRTVDLDGKVGFVLTLQAREQHIRRDKATSNVCTNQALAAMASLITILWYGKEGLPLLSLTNYQKCAYLKEHVAQIPGVKMLNDSPFLNEFAYKLQVPIDDAFEKFRLENIEPGVDLGKFYPTLQGYLLVAVTETKTIDQLNHYVNVLKGL